MTAAPSCRGSGGEIPKSSDDAVLRHGQRAGRAIVSSMKTSTDASLSTRLTIWPRVAPKATGQAVELGLASGIGPAPIGCQQATFLKPVQGRIKRSLRYLHDIPRDLLQALGYGVAVDRTERALGKIGI